MVPCAGTTGAQESRHPTLVLAGLSCSLRLLTPHSRCSQFSHPGEQPGDIMRCHEMHIDSPALASTGRYQIAPPSPALTLRPCWPPSALGRHITLWPSADGSTFDASLACLPGPTRASEALGPAHHAIPGRTSHHGSIALTSLDCNRHPCSPSCVGALFVCYAISGSEFLDCQIVRLSD